MRKFLISLVLSLFLTISLSWAEEKKETKLEEIVVTTTKIEKKPEDLPFSANVITSDEISKKPTLTAEHLIRHIAGVQTFRPHSATYGVHLTMRGHALVKQLVALDGQPINDGFNGYVRWSVLPSDIWEQIEIIKGPQSALYGPYAMGGVINFIPKSVIEEGDNEIKASIGSFGVYSGSVLTGLKIKDKLNLVFFADEKRIGGYIGDFVVVTPRTTPPSSPIIPVTGWEKTLTREGKIAYIVGDRGKQYSKDHRNLYLGINYNFTPTSELTMNYLYGRQRYGFEGEKTYLKDSSGQPINSGNVSLVDGGTTYYLTLSPLSYFDMEGIAGQDILNIKYKNILSENLSLKAFAGLNTRVQKWASPRTGATSSGGPGLKGTPGGLSLRVGLEGESKMTIYDMKNTLIIGSEVTFNSGGAKREALLNWKDRNSVTSLEEDAKGKSKIMSIYLLNELFPLDNVSLWAGGRYDMWKKYDGKMITPTKTTEFPDETISRFSPKIGVLAKPYEVLSIRASYGEGFRVPNPHELYRQMITTTSVSLGNPNLKPEYNKSLEAGIELYPAKKIKAFDSIKAIKINLYTDKTNDLIYIKRWKAPHPETGTEVDFSQRQNAGKAKNQGIEAEITGKSIELPFKASLSWFANLSLQKPKIKENPLQPNIVGKIIPYIHRKAFNVGVNIEKERFFSTFSMHTRGKVYVNDDNSDIMNNVPGSTDPFTVFDITSGYKVTKNATISLAVTNLFDKKYYSMGQLAPGRSIAAELSLKF